jgi:hypothetical protein
MIGKPQFGWSHITIGEWSDRISYLDDVPFELLRTLIRGCKEHRPQCLKFDAEGYEYILVFEWHNVFVIYQDTFIPRTAGKKGTSEFAAKCLEADRDELAMSLIRDIRENADAWATFYAMCDDYTDERNEDRKRMLLALCNELESLIPSDDHRLIHVATGKEVTLSKETHNGEENS